MTPTFVAPRTLSEALAALANGAVPLAGGTDLVVGHRQGKRLLPDAIVSIERVTDLSGIQPSADGGVTIKALTTHEMVVAHELLRHRYAGLADASAIVGSVATRSTGTLGGNVMNASPAADTIAPLLCHDGVAVLASPTGTRHVPLSDLFVGPGRTNALPTELLVAIDLAPSGPRTGSAYVRLEYRRHMEIAIVGAAALVEFDEAGTIVHARIAMTALAPTVRRVEEAEATLVGTSGDRSAAQSAGDAVARHSAPITDVRGSADYRRAMAAVVTRRAVEAAVVRAHGNAVRIPASDSTFGAGAGQ